MPRRRDRTESTLATILLVAVILLVGGYYAMARRSCDERGGELVRGAVKPFTCVVAQPDRNDGGKK
jgi:hypothetical protein